MSKFLTNNNPKLCLVNVNVHTKFCHIMLIQCQARSYQCYNIVLIITNNNPKLGIVNVNVHTKFGHIMLILRQARSCQG